MNVFRVFRRCASTIFKENVIKIDNHPINYLKVGEGEHNLICLPGALGTIWSDFKPQIEGLDKSKFTVVALDPIGYGKSRPPSRKFDVKFYHKDAEISSKLMETLNIKKYSILGWSDGGISALIQAAAHPERINKLAIWGSNAYITKDDMTHYEAIRDTSKWSEKMRSPLEIVYGADNLRDMMIDWYNALDKIYKQGGDICKNDVKKISSPVLILHGDKDPVVPGEHPLYLKDNLKNARLHRFPDGKHNIHLRYAKEFNDIVTKFLLEA
ncbi:valacyclovir hydrolase-like [Nesidiocoris tenuis]|uniref:Valacyclovir hydrolase-like n=1 Tax=Nesidiocoris tenuis TaxID=355587 RepID=A0ABN7A8J6_9HEMI|nr:valacyclovir hydrolase-like [Nesidiocoris tenuis]